MKRDWKPGDVAMVKFAWQVSREPMVVCIRAEKGGAPGWLHPGKLGGFTSDRAPAGPVSVRPLVVIDPEDREQVERLAQAYLDKFGGNLAAEAIADQMQAALREFADPKPPRPEEPTDPKVRVTDRRENTWRLLADGDWVCVDGPDIGEYLVWWQLADDRGPLEVSS